MRKVFFISILLISSCISVNKQKMKAHNSTVPSVRKTAAFKAYETFGNWLDKICVITVRQAHSLFQTALYPAKTLSATRDGGFEGGDYYFIVRLKDGDGIILDYSVRECDKKYKNQTTYISSKSFIEWLEEAKIYRLSDAKKLFTAMTTEKPVSPIGKEIRIEITDTRQDEQFYYLNTATGKTYKVGKGEECPAVKPAS